MIFLDISAIAGKKVPTEVCNKFVAFIKYEMSCLNDEDTVLMIFSEKSEINFFIIRFFSSWCTIIISSYFSATFLIWLYGKGLYCGCVFESQTSPPLKCTTRTLSGIVSTSFSKETIGTIYFSHISFFVFKNLS